MPSWLITVLAGLGGILAGFGLAVLAVRGRLRRLESAQRADPLERLRHRARAEGGEPEAQAPERGSPLSLVRRALRDPLARLRRAQGCPPESLAELEHIAWQCRMLTAAARPMKAVPTPPVELLQRAAEDVDLLRLGKVAASWTLRDRQPIHVDAERAGAAFRELLTAAARLEGEGGRLAIRLLPTHDGRHPVAVEIETGRRTGELDPLALRVGRHLLEGQGARVEEADLILRIHLPHLPPEEDLDEP